MDREVSGNGREGVAIYRAGQVGSKANLVGAKSHQVTVRIDVCTSVCNRGFGKPPRLSLLRRSSSVDAGAAA